MKQVLKYIFRILPAVLLLNLSCKKETSCEGCRDHNKPPVAIAGPDQVIALPTDSVSLDGIASNDPDGIISVWRREKISGPVSLILKSATNIMKSLSSHIWEE